MLASHLVATTNLQLLGFAQAIMCSYSRMLGTATAMKLDGGTIVMLVDCNSKRKSRIMLCRLCLDLWNRRRLRAGDHLQPDDGKRARTSRKPVPQQWTPQGCLEVAFSRVASTAGRLTRPTHRTSDAAALVVMTSIKQQAEHLNNSPIPYIQRLHPHKITNERIKK